MATKLKPPPAQEILESELGEPILARWHVGLGWTLAWTSDVKNLWAVEWLRWPQWSQFWGQLVREHMRQKKRQVFDMRAEIDPATGHVHAGARRHRRRRPLRERPRRGAHHHRTAAGRRPRARSPMPQTAPGRYEADFPLDRYGSFLLHAALEKPIDDGHGNMKSATVAESFGHVTNPYPREYLALVARRRHARARGRRRRAEALDPAPAAVFDPAGEVIRYHEDLWPRFVGVAIALFLLDLLVRRVRIFDRKKTAARRASSAPRSREQFLWRTRPEPAATTQTAPRVACI